MTSKLARGGGFIRQMEMRAFRPAVITANFILLLALRPAIALDLGRHAIGSKGVKTKGVVRHSSKRCKEVGHSRAVTKQIWRWVMMDRQTIRISQRMETVSIT